MVETQLGVFTVLLNELGRLTAVSIGAAPAWPERPDAPAHLAAAALAQLAEYADGRRTTFDLPLAAAGTAFQRAVWAELGRIPFGQTRSYAQVAAAIGRPTACRAVGAANGQNPIAVVVPCHRVIGSSGNLVGYAGGMDFKQRLLVHERAVVSPIAARLAGISDRRSADLARRTQRRDLAAPLIPLFEAAPA